MTSRKKKSELESLCKAQGIILNPNVKYTKEMLVNKLGDKTLESGLVKPSWGLIERRKTRNLMICQWFKRLKKEQKEIIIADDNNWVAERKFNGCFEWHTPILLSDGSTLPIGEIVDNQLPVEVMSYNTTTQQLVPKKVVGWFNNGKKSDEEWCKLSYQPSRTSKLTITKNHNVYTKNRGWVEAKNITQEDSLVYCSNMLNNTQMQIVYGSILGDGALPVEKRSLRKIKPTSIFFAHSKKQLDYLKKKVECLGEDKSRISKYISGYGSECYRFKSSPKLGLGELRIKYYSSTKKCLDTDLLNKLNNLGLAVWYMDDGTRHKDCTEMNCTNKYSRITLAACRYSETEVNAIISYFCSIGLRAKKRLLKKKYYVIDFDSNNSQEFFRRVAPYIPKSMEYKLPGYLRGQEKIEWWNDNNPMLGEYTLSTKEPNSDVYHGSYTAYDIEVEDTHCYFANNILVHNCRIGIYYHPDWGFQFFSRHTSDVSFLPIEYSNLLINMGNELLQGSDFKGKYNFPFIIDSEVITTNKELDLSILPRHANKLFGAEVRPDFIIKSELNSACSILQYNDEDSFLLQKQNPMVFQVFDITMINNQYLYNTPLYQRLKILDELLKYLPSCFQPCNLVRVKKMDYYENLITNENAEGVVFKNLNSIYNTAGTRHADKWVKLKRSLAGDLGKDIDAFVSGFTPGVVGTRNEGLVGSLEFSVYLMDKNGLTKPHVIANISGFSDEFRNLISTKDREGNAALKDELYNKVFAINGHTVSTVNLRFNHAVLVSEYPRLDKNYYQCDLPEEVLRQSIL